MLYALRQGALDAVPIERVAAWLDALGRRLETLHPELLRKLETRTALTADVESLLRSAFEAVGRDIAQEARP